MLASKRKPFDPMEIAFREFGAATLSGTEHLHEDWDLVAEYPLTDDLLSLSRVWQSPSTGQRIIAVKGAPEAVADLCHFDPTHVTRLHERLAAMTDDGLRVLGVARGSSSEAILSPPHSTTSTSSSWVWWAWPIRCGTACVSR